MAHRIFKIVIVLSLFGFFLLSCSSEDEFVSPEVILNQDVTLAINESYIYDLSNGVATAGGFTISTQAVHFEISEIQINQEANGVIKTQYVYQPSLDYLGVDHVEIVNCISAGGSNCSSTQLLKFNFTISDGG